jgi:hypothetical protein
MNTLLTVTPPPFEMGLMSWVGVAIATAIIFAIHGANLAKDIRGWMAARR